MTTLTLRSVAHELPALEVVIQNNIPIRITLTVHARVIDPLKAIVEGKPYTSSLTPFAKSVLQIIIGQYGLLAMQEERKRIQAALSTLADRWGVQVTHVEIKDIDLPFEVQCALAAVNSPEWRAEMDKSLDGGKILSL